MPRGAAPAGAACEAPLGKSVPPLPPPPEGCGGTPHFQRAGTAPDPPAYPPLPPFACDHGGALLRRSRARARAGASRPPLTRRAAIPRGNVPSVPPHAFVAGVTVVIDTAAIAATLSQTIDGKFMCKATAVGAAGYSAQCLLMPETCRKMYWTYVRPAASPALAARATC